MEMRWKAAGDRSPGEGLMEVRVGEARVSVNCSI
jgi:hypothetical protein